MSFNKYEKNAWRETMLANTATQLATFKKKLEEADAKIPTLSGVDKENWVKYRESLNNRYQYLLTKI